MTIRHMTRVAAFAAATVAVFAASPAMAKQCSPKDTTARILQSANPNDLHPQWRGESHIGTAWSLDVKRTLNQNGVKFLQGELLSPRGNSQGEIFAIVAEWYCG